MKKEYIEEAVKTFSVFDIGGPIDKGISFLKSIKDTYSEYTDLNLRSSGWNDSKLILYGSRIETDKELEKRKKRLDASKQANKVKKEKKEAKDKATLARLKKKYGDI